MPIQPRSPTLRENAGTSVSSRLGLNGEKVPAAISSARKARTSLRSCSHFSGRRIGSKRRAAVIVVLSNLMFLFEHDFFGKPLHTFPDHALAGSDQRPQFVSAARGYAFAELDRPVALGAEIVAPGQRAQGEAVQDVLDGEADRAMHLVGDGAALFSRFRTADFCRDRFQEDGVIVEGGVVANSVRGRGR